jgi:aspartyl-tRNA(Asn)/glutamyl-tRNA(Gln) amidotransferase subunit A
MDHVGPMARSAADCALVLGAMAGYDAADPTTSVLPVPNYMAALTGDVRGFRVGLLRSFFLESATTEVRAAVEGAARTLEKAGALVDDVALPSIRHVSAGALAVVASEALTYHAAWLRTRRADYDPEVSTRLMLGAFVTGLHYVRGQQARALIRREVDESLARHDVLLAPATPIPAPAIDERQTSLGDGSSDVRSALIRLTRPFNFSGHPACSVPCGFTAGGMPIGMQIVGRPFDEATVFRAADAYQRVTDWHTRRPVLA